MTASAPTESENAQKRWKAATVEYTDILNDQSVPLVEKLNRLVERGDMLSLRQLLAANDFQWLVPMEMASESDWTALRDQKATKKITTTSGERIVALAKVRRSGERGTAEREPENLKEAAFVFDAEGYLTGVIGGGETAGDQVTFTNVGGTFNFFVRVAGFEQHGDYELRESLVQG